MKIRIAVFSFIILLTVLAYPIPAFASDITLDGSFGDWADKPQLADPAGDEEAFRDFDLVKWYPDPENGFLYLYCERVVDEDKKALNSNNGNNGNGGNDNNNNGNNGRNKNDDRYDESCENGNIDENDIYNDIFGNIFNNNRRFKYWFLTVDLSSELGDRTAYVFYHPASRWVYVLLFDKQWQYLWSAYGKWGEDKDPGRQIEFKIPLDQLVSSVQSGYQIDMHFTCWNDRVPDTGEITVSTISTFPWQSSAALAGFAFTGFLLITVRGKRFFKGVK